MFSGEPGIRSATIAAIVELWRDAMGPAVQVETAFPGDRTSDLVVYFAGTVEESESTVAGWSAGCATIDETFTLEFEVRCGEVGLTDDDALARAERIQDVCIEMIQLTPSLGDLSARYSDLHQCIPRPGDLDRFQVDQVGPVVMGSVLVDCAVRRHRPEGDTP